MNSYTQDAELVLRDSADGAETSTTAETGIAFPALAAGTFHVIVDVSALDEGDGDETYVVAVETDSLAAFSDSPVEVARTVVTETGRHVLTVSSDLIAKLDPDAAALRVKATLAGTSPSISYGAFVAPVF